MPSLLVAATNCRPPASLKTIGDVPQSPSKPGAGRGTGHDPFSDSVVASSATMAPLNVWRGSPTLPVVMYTVFEAVSMPGEVQIPPPTCPLGTTLKVLTTWCVLRLT